MQRLPSVASDGFCVRTAEYRGSVLANICDQELVGRTVTEGRLQVQLTKEFYIGETLGASETLKLIRSCAVVNLAGKRSVSLAINNGVGAREAVRQIEDVPFLMVYKFLR